MQRLLAVSALVALGAIPAASEDGRLPPREPVRADAISRPTATVPTSGRFVFNFTIYIKTAVRDPLYCSAYVDHGSVYRYSASRGNQAIRKGATATCRIVIAYNWPEADDTYKVRLDYTVSANGPDDNRYYYVSGDLPDVPLPPSGTVQTYNITATM